MLTTSVEHLEGSSVRLTIAVAAQDVDEAIARAYKSTGTKLRIPGFRRGKAPRPVIDNYVGRSQVLAEATEVLVNDSYPRALDAEKLRPIESPEIEGLDTVEPGQDYTFTVEVALRPELEVASYEDITVEAPRREVVDADIDAHLDELRERFATLVPVEDRGISAGDFVLLSFTGYVDGETYEGNAVDKYLYETDRGLMPAEFDEGLAGLAPGAETRIEFTIPESSSNPEYVGKTAQFDVNIHEVKAKKLPEVTDDFSAEMGFDTVELLREDIRSRLDLQRLLAYNRAKEKAAREVLASRTPGEIPEAMIKSRAQSLETDFNTRLKEQGLSLEAYANMTGMTREDFESNVMRDAEQQVREDLALESLFRKLGYEVTEDDIDKELEDVANASKITAEEAREKWKSMGLTSILSEGVMHRRAVGWLMENVEAVETETEDNGSASEASRGTKKASAKRASKKKDKQDESSE